MLKRLCACCACFESKQEIDPTESSKTTTTEFENALHACKFEDNHGFNYCNREIVVRIAKFSLRSVGLIVLNALFMAYLFVYGVASTALISLTIISMFLAPVVYFIILLIWFKKSVFLRFQINSIIKMLISITIVSIFGFSEILLGLLDLGKLRFGFIPSRFIQIVFQIAVVAANTEEFGGLPIAFLTLAPIQLIETGLEVRLIQMDLSKPGNTYSLEAFNFLFEGTSKALLNWMDIITDIIYVLTAEFYSPVLLAFSIICLFTSPLLQAFMHYKKSHRSASAFIRAFVSSILGVYDAQIGYELFKYELFKESKTNLVSYFNFASLIHTLFESLPQLLLQLVNSLLVGNPTTIFYLSTSVSVLMVIKAIVTQGMGARNAATSVVPTVKINRAGENLLAILLGLAWNINLSYVVFCNSKYFIAAVVISILSFTFLVFPPYFSYYSIRHYRGLNCDTLYLRYLPFVLFYHLPIEFVEKSSKPIICFIYYSIVKCIPMFLLLVLNAVCNSHMNSFSVAVVILLILDFLLEMACIIPEDKKLVYVGDTKSEENARGHPYKSGPDFKFMIKFTILKMNGREKFKDIEEGKNKCKLNVVSFISDEFPEFAAELILMKINQVTEFKFDKSTSIFRVLKNGKPDEESMILEIKLLKVKYFLTS